MKTNYKNIFLGIIIGVIGTCGVFFIVGDVNVETEIQIGEKLDDDNKNIDISIEKTVDDNGKEIINILANGSGTVTKKEIEQELERLYVEKDIDISSGDVDIKINITN